MIRAVRLSDSEHIAGLYNRYVTETTVSFETEPLTVEAMRDRIKAVSETFPYFVWEDEGRAVAHCYAHQWKERAAYCHTWETTIYISQEYHGCGIGRMLMACLIDECRKRGAYSLIACVTAENMASIGFHEAIGFRRVSFFSGVGMKFGRRLDVVDLQLDL